MEIVYCAVRISFVPAKLTSRLHVNRWELRYENSTLDTTPTPLCPPTRLHDVIRRKLKKNVPTDVLKKDVEKDVKNEWANGVNMQGKRSCRVVSGTKVSKLSN
jgi:hypothetical protein